MDLEKLTLPLDVADKAFKIGIGAAIAGTTALIGAMGMAIKATFDWANELDSIGDVMDVTNEQAAAFGFIARKSGVATETFTKAVVIMSKGLVKADGTLDTVGKGLESWGINVKDVNGKLKSQTALVNDISKKYNTFATQQEKVNFLTEVFGRSGAEMVDFFDVMANEGGLDAVTEKVKAFGLAIDPGRYEQFTRNLEELKLIGTGLAVMFTEKLMPVLENVMTWFGNFAAQSPEENFTMLKNTVHDLLGGLFNLTDAFERGVGEIDWAGLSQRLADGVNNIDWALVGLYIRGGITNVLQGIGTVVSEIDWQALADATGTSLAELVAGLYGYADWDSFATDFKEGVGLASKEVISSIGLMLISVAQSILDTISGIITGMGNSFEMGLVGMKNSFNNFVNEINAAFARITGIQLPSISMSLAGAATGGAKRASGGAVIAGQRYQVSEFSRPETFTPATNGRIDPLQPAMAGMGDDVFIQRFADVIARSLRSELQKSGRK